MVAVAVVAPSACGGADAIPFTLKVEPQFVQGAIPGAATGVLITITDQGETDEPVELAVTAQGARVSVVPSAIREGDVAEATVVPEATDVERPLEIIVTGRRGGVEASATKSTTVFPWKDDRAEYAATLLDLFMSWLAESEPELGLGPATELSGSLVAPGLLVVSHYLFMSDDWEVGLSWHVMMAPDDWAEIYLRPRDEMSPVLAFRLRSQTAANEEGIIEIEKVTPPAEVVR